MGTTQTAYQEVIDVADGEGVTGASTQDDDGYSVQVSGASPVNSGRDGNDARYLPEQGGDPTADDKGSNPDIDRRHRQSGPGVMDIFPDISGALKSSGGRHSLIRHARYMVDTAEGVEAGESVPLSLDQIVASAQAAKAAQTDNGPLPILLARLPVPGGSMGAVRSAAPSPGQDRSAVPADDSGLQATRTASAGEADRSGADLPRTGAPASPASIGAPTPSVTSAPPVPPPPVSPAPPAEPTSFPQEPVTAEPAAREETFPDLGTAVRAGEQGPGSRSASSTSARFWGHGTAGRAGHGPRTAARGIPIVPGSGAGDTAIQPVFGPLASELATGSLPRIYGGQHRDPRRRTWRLRTLAAVLTVLVLIAGWVLVRTFVLEKGSSTEVSTESVEASASAGLLSEAEILLAEDPQLALRLEIAAVALGDGDAAQDLLRAHLLSTGAAQLEKPTQRIPLDAVATAVALRPDRGLVATGTGASTVSLIPPDSPDERIAIAGGPNSSVSELSFAPDGTVLAVGYQGGQVALFDVSDPRNVSVASTLVVGNDAVSSISFSSDGSLLAVAGLDGAAVLWEVKSPAEPVQLDTVTARSSAITEDGSLLVTGSADGLSLFGIEDTGLVRKDDLVTAGDVVQLAVDVQGRNVVTVSTSGAGAVWDISDEESPTLTARIDVPGGRLDQVVVSEDSPLLVGAHSKGMLAWDLEQPSQPTQLSAVGVDQAPSILGGFSSDGTWLLTATEDEALIWAGVAWFSPGRDVITHACELTDGGLTPRQWQEYLPGIAFRNTCMR